MSQAGVLLDRDDTIIVDRSPVGRRAARVPVDRGTCARRRAVGGGPPRRRRRARRPRLLLLSGWPLAGGRTSARRWGTTPLSWTARTSRGRTARSYGPGTPAAGWSSPMPSPAACPAGAPSTTGTAAAAARRAPPISRARHRNPRAQNGGRGRRFAAAPGPARLAPRPADRGGPQRAAGAVAVDATRPPCSSCRGTWSGTRTAATSIRPSADTRSDSVERSLR